MSVMRSLVIVGVLAAVATAAEAAPKYVIVDGSASPDGKWVVVIPPRGSLDDEETPPCETRLANAKTGALLVRIPGECFFEHQGQIQFAAAWSKDSQTLVWRTDNKWGSANVQVVQLKGDKVGSIYDARPAAEDRVLAAVKKASAKAYAASRERGKGNGAWFRDGFAIDVHPSVTTMVSWPIAFTIDITSDYKCDGAAGDRAGGTMTATLDAAHTWTFGPFVAGHKGCGSGGLVCAFSDCN
jgi:hypothetical protein